MIRITKLISVAVLVQMSFLSLSQERIIKGKVLDAQTKEPLAFATVSIKGGTSGVVSNFFGEFELSLESPDLSDSLLISMNLNSD